MLRRAHQKATGIFNAVMGEFGVTPTQFAALAKLHDVGRVSQNELGRLTAMDPATIWGVVNRLCEPGKVLDEALEMAEAITANAPLSVRQAKKSIHFGLQMDLRTGYRFEIEAYNQLVATEDRKEGVRAFNEKRKPRFQGK